jgi:hypothetical protein
MGMDEAVVRSSSFTPGLAISWNRIALNRSPTM